MSLSENQCAVILIFFFGTLMTFNILNGNYSTLFFYLIFFSPYIYRYVVYLSNQFLQKYKFQKLKSKICQNLKFKEIKDIENQMDNECSICLDDVFDDDDITILPCGCIQLYHPKCILDWLRIKPSCPTCRKDFI